MADNAEKKSSSPYPVDPNLNGAYPGGPPQVPAETSEWILRKPAEAQAELKRRMGKAQQIWDNYAASKADPPPSDAGQGPQTTGTQSSGG